MNKKKRKDKVFKYSDFKGPEEVTRSKYEGMASQRSPKKKKEGLETSSTKRDTITGYLSKPSDPILENILVLPDCIETLYSEIVKEEDHV